MYLQLKKSSAKKASKEQLESPTSMPQSKYVVGSRYTTPFNSKKVVYNESKTPAPTPLSVEQVKIKKEQIKAVKPNYFDEIPISKRQREFPPKSKAVVVRKRSTDRSPAVKKTKQKEKTPSNPGFLRLWRRFFPFYYNNVIFAIRFNINNLLLFRLCFVTNCLFFV